MAIDRASQPRVWDEWLIRPGDCGYSMVLARYASQQVYTEMERSSAEDRAYVSVRRASSDAAV